MKILKTKKIKLLIDSYIKYINLLHDEYEELVNFAETPLVYKFKNGDIQTTELIKKNISIPKLDVVNSIDVLLDFKNIILKKSFPILILNKKDLLELNVLLTTVECHITLLHKYIHILAVQSIEYGWKSSKINDGEIIREEINRYKNGIYLF